jgi:predicted TPR repeat methyltransferase
MKMIKFELIEKLHREGLLDEAKAAYLKYLKSHPSSGIALHGLGLLYAQLGEFNSAITYFESALSFEQNNPVFYLNLANAYKMVQQFEKAKDALLTAIAIEPRYAAALNNLGTVYLGLQKVNEAIAWLYRAIEIAPEYIDAYYNLGLALTQHKDYKDAKQVYQKLLVLDAHHLAAQFQLAKLHLLEEDYTTALTLFLHIEKVQAHHFETQTNLAHCYLKLGKMQEAKIHYLKAHDLNSNDVQVLYNLGIVFMELGNLDFAIQYYQKGVLADPDNFALHNNLGVAFLAKNHPAYALTHFKKALALIPHNQAIEYVITMLSQDKRLQAAPSDYIKILFNSYADHYDQHLVTGLAYQIPYFFLSAFKKLKNPLINFHLLDLGCGTGLCGEAFNPYAKTMVGVDLSENMLAFSAQKNIYTELICDSIENYLIEDTRVFDVVIAGDVLVYMGELKQLFSLVHARLSQNGYFIFNTEAGEADDFQMNQSGRFSHNKRYCDALIKASHFTLCSYECVPTRQQNSDAVMGHIYVLQKDKGISETL